MKYRKMEGKWTFWWPNGKKECECEFAQEVPYTGAKVWYDNGVLKKKQTGPGPSGIPWIL